MILCANCWHHGTVSMASAIKPLASPMRQLWKAVRLHAGSQCACCMESLQSLTVPWQHCACWHCSSLLGTML